VVFVHVNENPILGARYGVSGIPHLVFFDSDGQKAHEHTGFMPKEQIEEWLGKIGVEIED
jgi:thioredoxin-like negative regulator of GroEL